MGRHHHLHMYSYPKQFAYLNRMSFGWIISTIPILWYHCYRALWQQLSNKTKVRHQRHSPATHIDQSWLSLPELTLTPHLFIPTDSSFSCSSSSSYFSSTSLCFLCCSLSPFFCSFFFSFHSSFAPSFSCSPSCRTWTNWF